MKTKWGQAKSLKIDADRVVWHEIEGEVVVLDIPSSTYLTLNSTGSHLWSRLEESAEYSQLVDSIVSEFEVTRQAAANDVALFLDDLDKREILVADTQSMVADTQSIVADT